MITDRKAVGGATALVEFLRAVLQRQQIDFVQVREKDLEARALYELACAVVKVRDESAERTALSASTRILINTRSDVALAAGADGVHLPAEAPSETLPGLLVFRSCHSISEVERAQADAVVFGPVYPSPGKGEGVGMEAVREASRLQKRVFALGGLTAAHDEECARAGAYGVAGIRRYL